MSVCERFIHENRPLREWLLQLIDQDAAKRKAAGQVVTNQFFLAIDLSPATPDEAEAFQEEFRKEVRKVVNAPDFPAADYVQQLLALELALHESWTDLNRQQFKREDEQHEVALAKLGENPTEAAKKRYVRRVWIQLLRDCREICEGEPHEIMSTGIALNCVIESLGAELLPAADILREMLQTRGKAHLALGAISRMGRDGLVFYDELVAELKSEGSRFYGANALGTLLQNAPEKLPEMLALATDSDAHVRTNAITVLGETGRGGAAAFRQIEAQLRNQLMKRTEASEWSALVYAL